MVTFFLGLQYSENLWRKGANFISSAASKVKVSYVSLPFWTMHVRKMEVLFYHSWPLFPLQPNDNQSVLVKVPGCDIHCHQMRKLEEDLVYP